MIPFLIPALLAVIFYLLIPGIEAYRVLHRWRVFRSQLSESTLFPLLDYAGLRSSNYSSRFRFYGRLEALEGRDYLWLREEEGAASVRVDMRNQGYWVMVDEADIPQRLSPFDQKENVPKPPEWVPWREASALVEGSQFFVYGPLVSEEGQGTFHGSTEKSLLVILYEGRKEDLHVRGIWSGRQLNEYWNPLTPFSLILGFLVLVTLGFFWYKIPGLKEGALWAVALSILPQTIFLPPGVFFFYFFNRYWALGRWFRAYRDMVVLPLRYWGPRPTEIQHDLVTQLPNGGEYRISLGDARCTPGSGRAQLILWKSQLSENLVFVSSTGKDPATPSVVFGEMPYRLYRLAIKQARRGELLALGFFFLGAGVNLGLLILLFRVFLIKS